MPGEHEIRARDGDDGLVLVDGAVVAYWADVRRPRPDAAMVPGFLSGTVHGGVVPEGLPAISGPVRRVRLVRQDFAAVEEGRERRLDRVPGTLTLTDVAESPHRFEIPPLIPGTTGSHEIGVLIEVDVPLVAEPPPT